MADVVVFDVKKELGIKDAPDRLMVACGRFMGKIMELARQEAREAAPELSGRLKGTLGGFGGITFRVDYSDDSIEGILVAVARDPETGLDYALFIHQGTGKYGPKKARITPKKGKVLVFLKEEFRHLPRPKTPDQWKEYRKGGMLVYAKSTKGIKPNKFLLTGLKKAKTRAKDFMDAEIREMNRSVT